MLNNFKEALRRGSNWPMEEVGKERVTTTKEALDEGGDKGGIFGRRWWRWRELRMKASTSEGALHEASVVEGYSHENNDDGRGYR